MQNGIDLTKLQHLGLTERESKVYVALVSRGPVLPKQIPALTPVPRAKIYETLYRLLQLGLITERHLDQKKYYEAVPPDDAIQHLLASSELEMETRRQAGAQLQSELMAIFQARRGANAQDYFKFLQNPTQIIRINEELQRGLRAELMAFVKPPYVMNPDLDANLSQLEALKRGVQYRCIYEVENLQLSDRRHRPQVLPYVNAGEQARVFQELPIKLAIFDRRISLLQFVDLKLPERRTTIMIDNTGIATTFAACFEYYWQQSVPFLEFLRANPPVQDLDG
jgi:HTH-type transcriptional regulator, sugar sensing transcriptional regulator